MSEAKIVQEWLRYANNDLIVAKHCFEEFSPKQTEISAYHAQQCAEKSLKAYLIYNDVDPPRVHDLKILCKMCREYDDTFSAIEILCAHLTPFGIAVRYPDEIAPNESMAATALSNARQVYDFCLAKIGHAGDTANKS
jgi:HEPN domain-containing protein